MSNSHDIYLSDSSVAFYTEQILSGNIQSIIPEVDSFIKEYYKNIHGRLNGSRLRKAFLDARPFLRLYFDNRYLDSLSYRETVFRIMNDIEMRPVCKTCRGTVRPVAFDTDKFNDFCCNRCAQSNKDIIEKKKQTTLKNFGVEWGTQCEEVQEKRKATCIEKFGADNAMRSDEVKEGMRERHRAKYGCDYSFQRKEVIEKSEETCLRKYGVRHASELKEFQEKAEETCLKNHGVRHPMQSKEIKKKSAETSLRKYGVTNPNKTQETKDKISNTCLEKYGSKSYLQSKDYKAYMVEYNEKLFEERGVNNYSQLPEVREKTKQTNLRKYGVENTYQIDYVKAKTRYLRIRHSKGENDLYDILVSVFGFDNVKREYKSINYPFFCDFYITTLNLYIEYQGYWMHNSHPFRNTSEDQQQIEFWLSRKYKSSMYESAVIAWSQKDPLKRQTAKNNNLNYLEIFPAFPLEEVPNFIKENFNVDNPKQIIIGEK